MIRRNENVILVLMKEVGVIEILSLRKSKLKGR